MIKIHAFTFSPFMENTYILSDETGECVVIDPGCYESNEKKQLADFIVEEELKPVRLLNTHCHIDHVFGNAFVSRTYGLKPEMHKKDLPTLQMVGPSAQLYGLQGTELSPEPGNFLDENDTVEFGNSSLEILFVPGHAPGHIAFLNREQDFVIAGDVLFREGIGRTDLPGGSMDVLMETIRDQMYTLPDSTTVYSGHGPETTIGHEKQHNPFIRG